MKLLRRRYPLDKPSPQQAEVNANSARKLRKSESTVVLASVLQSAEWGSLKGPANSDDLWVILAGVVEQRLKQRGWTLMPPTQKGKPAPKPRPNIGEDPGKVSG